MAKLTMSRVGNTLINQYNKWLYTKDQRE